MTRSAPRFLALAVLLIIAALGLNACGDDGGSREKTGTSDAIAAKGDAGRLTHVDGSITLEGDELTVEPSAGGADVVLTLGSAVARGTVQALVSTNARARVFYKDDEERSLTAVAVEPAPTAGENAETYDGKITDVSETSITIDGDDGERTFAIEAKDQPSFDIPHLEDHQAEQSPVRVYYEGSGDDAHAVAYEDA